MLVGCIILICNVDIIDYVGRENQKNGGKA